MIVSVSVADVGAASVNVNDTKPVASVTRLVETVEVLRPETDATIASPDLAAPY